MQMSNLNLGFYIRRDVLEPCGGARIALPSIDANALIIFPHDLKAFAIPHEHVTVLADTYRRYLVASSIFDKSIVVSDKLQGEQNDDEEALMYDHTTLVLIHKAFGVPFEEGVFNLDAAIGFVEEEAGLSKTLAIRWCMMMEYISFEDQRIDTLLNSKAYNGSDETVAKAATIHPCIDTGGGDG